MRRWALGSGALLVLAALALLLWWRATRDPGAHAPAIDRDRGAPRAETPRPRAPIWLSPAFGVPEPDGAGGVLVGRVVSAAGGAPAPNAQLTFLHAGAVSAVSADAHGAFRFAPAEPGEYALQGATAAGFLPYEPALGHSPVRFSARPGVRVEGVVIALEPAVDYAVLVLDPAGAPLAEATVRLLDPPGERAAITDAHGAAQLAAPDGALVEARHARFSAGRATVDLAAQGSHRLTIKLRPPIANAREAALAGTVLDAAGAPAAEALVRARGPGEAGAFGAATSDVAGRFRIEHLDEGDYTISAELPGAAPAEAKVHAPADGITLRLAAGGRIAGTVRDSTGKPTPAFVVSARQRLGALARSSPVVLSVFDASGRYELAGLTAGHWFVTAAAHGLASAPEVEVDVDSAGAAAHADLTLPAGGRLTGRVTESGNGRAIAGARVTLEGGLDPGDSPVPLLSSATTDGDGNFALGGLRAGLRSLFVAAEAHHSRILSGLRVEEGGDLGPVAIDLRPTEPGEAPRIELTGIGAVLSVHDDALVVGRLLPGGGGAEAGLQPGDTVLAIDGLDVTALGFEGAVQRIRGPEGSTVRLLIRRGDASRELAVVRRRVSG